LNPEQDNKVGMFSFDNHHGVNEQIR